MQQQPERFSADMRCDRNGISGARLFLEKEVADNLHLSHDFKGKGRVHL